MCTESAGVAAAPTASAAGSCNRHGVCGGQLYCAWGAQAGAATHMESAGFSSAPRAMAGTAECRRRRRRQSMQTGESR